MAKYSRLEVATRIKQQGLVPLFFDADPQVGIKVMEACYQGGARILEFTNRGDFAHETFRVLQQYCLSNLPGLMLGVGSVTDAGTTALYLQNGAQFVVTPLFRQDVAMVCNRRKVLWLPGCSSLGEIAKAEEVGAEIIKLFPGGVYGPGFISAIRGPQPWTDIMPTGGVAPNKENLKAWIAAGACAVGMGSKLIKANETGQYDFQDIENKVRYSLDLIYTLRGDTSP